MNSELSNILFLDIETVSQYENHEKLPERFKILFEKKVSYYTEKEDCSQAEAYQKRAAIYAEFGKVITIGLGFFAKEADEWKFRVTCLMAHDEKSLLEEFITVLSKFNEENLLLCAHNGKEFDFPYLCRRFLVNGLKIPYCLDMSGRKPWEVQHLDTMHLWRFGDYKHYTSLETLAAIFDVPTSKTDIDGSMVGEVYYKEKDLKRIAEYCKQDVVVAAQVYLKMKALPLLDVSQVVTI